MKRLFVPISIIVLLEWSTCLAAIYLSPFGFSVDIPSHWKMTNSRILMENPEREKALDMVFKALSYPEEKKKEIIHALKNGQVEYWHYRGTASNATCRKVKGKGVLKSSEFKEFIGRFKKLYNVEVYDIGLKKIAGLDVFYYEWGGLVHGLRALQLNMQINQAEYLQFTLGTQDEKFETLKGEFWQIISTFKLF